jgi:hypothetical protein
MTLSDKQQQFTLMVAGLITWLYEHGYAATFGEAYRTPEQAALNAQHGTGIANSLHTQRLAVDLNLFKDGTFLTALGDYQPAGEQWEAIGGSWGGRFSKPDADHFSLSPDSGATR